MKRYHELTPRLIQAIIRLKEAADALAEYNAESRSNAISGMIRLGYHRDISGIDVHLFNPLIDSTTEEFDEDSNQMVRVVDGVRLFAIVGKEEEIE